MEYQVPQFIEIEDKIFGPLTLKQFIYLAGAAGLCTILVLYVPLVIGIILAIPVAALGLALAFYKINNKSFVEVLEAGFSYLMAGRLYLWKKEPKQKEAQQAPVPVAPVREKLALNSSKLHDLALSLDIQDRASDA